MNKLLLIITAFLLGFVANYLVVIFFGVQSFSDANQGYGIKMHKQTYTKLSDLESKIDEVKTSISTLKQMDVEAKTVSNTHESSTESLDSVKVEPLPNESISKDSTKTDAK